MDIHSKGSFILQNESPLRSPRALRLRKRCGFTLLEVMIALAILALVGVAFLRAQAGSVRLLDESSQISLATLLAREKMAELEGMGFPEVGKNSGTGRRGLPSVPLGAGGNLHRAAGPPQGAGPGSLERRHPGTHA